ncbi:MAG TPA: hypothetical protein VK169_12770 [Saprospiraceae bacterium]|nr:hypothetical protein [Saprospiraceae bacterium]
MKEKEYKELRENTIEFLRNKKRNLYMGSSKKVYNSLMILMLFLFLQSFYSVYLLSDQGIHLIISPVFKGIGSILFSIEFYIIQLTPPDNEKRREDWLWQNGQRVFLLAIFGTILLVISIFLSDGLNIVNKIAVLVSCFNLVFVSLIIIYISYNPKYFLNSFLTGFGTSLVILTPIALSFVWVYKADLFTIGHFINSLIIGVALGYSWYTYKSNIKDKKFNLIQNSILRFLKPHQIIEALPAPLKLSLKNERKALNIMEKLNDNEEYEVELILLEKLQKKYEQNSLIKGYFGGVIIFLVLTIISALIEFVTQDHLYNPYLKDFFEKLMETYK